MDYNIATLDTATQIINFDYFERLANNDAREELARIRAKHKEHLAEFFSPISFYTDDGNLIGLQEIYQAILAALKGMKSKDIHAVIERLEKDTKKIKKIYKTQVS